MPEVIIKYKNARVLEVLSAFAKYFDFDVEHPKPKKKIKEDLNSSLPIVFADKPNVTALAGIWKDRDISLEDLRKNAWGNRI